MLILQAQRAMTFQLEAPPQNGRSLLKLNGISMFFRDSENTIGDEAWRSRERARKRREMLIQALFVAGLLLLAGFFVVNVESNLAAKNIKSGFGFLFNRAGFEISDQLVPYSSNDPFWKAFLVGLLNTLKVSGLTIVSATVLGVVVGLMRLARNPMLRFLGAAHVEAYRNIPLLVLLLALYLVVTELLPGVRQAIHLGNWFYLSKTGLLFSVPQMGGSAALFALVASALCGASFFYLSRRRYTSFVAGLFAIGAFVVTGLAVWVGCGAVSGWNHPVQTRFSMRGGLQITPEFLTLWVGLTLFTSASIAEIVRAGVESVRHGQWEAAYALGLTRGEAVSYVIFPQALRLIVPPLSSQFMTLTKNSSLAVMVGYPDLVNVGTTALNVTGQALEVICIIMLVYLTVNLIISLVMNAFNTRVTAGGI